MRPLDALPCPSALYRRLDRTGRIPSWVRAVWQDAHFCPELDDLLLVDRRSVLENCCCGRVPERAPDPDAAEFDLF